MEDFYSRPGEEYLSRDLNGNGKQCGAELASLVSSLTPSASFRGDVKGSKKKTPIRPSLEGGDVFHYLHGSDPVKVELNRLENEVRDAERGGPLVEYERRIAAGELMAGDKCQEETLRALQRLYDELVDAAEICGLERSSSSNKSNRSWFSFMVPQASLSPVHGLYLYGGVGTNKTMLMDTLYEQLPMADLKLRQKYA